MSTAYELDTMVKADETLCIGCGSCVRACPGGLITMEEFPVPIENGWGLCIDCGHCVAICPTEAMHQRSMGPEDCEPIDTLGLTEGYVPHGTFLLGRPAETSLRIPARSEVAVTWR